MNVNRRSLVFVILFIPMPLSAQVQPDSIPVSDETESPDNAAKVEGSTRQTSIKDEPDSGSFVPSEKIRADDAVSFPVDI